MSQEITLEQVRSQLVAGIEFSTTMDTIGDNMGGAIETLYAQLVGSGITPTGPVMAIYHEEMTPDRPWNCEVCVPVTEALTEHPVLRTHEVPGGLVATVTHKGPYDGLKDNYDRISAWFTEHGHTFAGPPREIYLNSPGEVADDELLTRIEFPAVAAPK